MKVRAALEVAIRREPVPPALLEAAFGEIMDGKASPVAIAALLVALRAKGETIDEIVAAARALRARADGAPMPDPRAIDTCGTGGDGSGTFNVSTAAAFVVAGAGVPVAKHGNRAATSRAGSADVLEALGVRADLPVARAAEIVREIGIGFLFARRAHPAMRHVAPVREELGVRTLMNCIGPLVNPCGVRRQLVGVYARELVEPLAHALALLGAEAALVVHGSDGLDEITTTGPTRVVELRHGAIRNFTIAPEDFGIVRSDGAALKGGDAAANAQAIRALFEGVQGSYRDIVLLNAAAALVIAEKAADMPAGIVLAADALDSGKAKATLADLARITNLRQQ
jgi:anthranilate phosphoribosyltransferase